MTIGIAICDDDAKDLQSVTDIFAAHGDTCSLQSFRSASDMLEKANKMDIAILNIFMEEIFKKHA